jgi:hypothetical protein
MILGRMFPGGRRATPLAAAMGLYALVAVVGPFQHHDLACHLKSRTHCTSCVVSASVASSSSGAALMARELADAGQCAVPAAPGLRSADILCAPGRSPPA